MPAGRQGRRREIDSGLMIQALAETRTMEQAAELLGCSAPSIGGRAKTDVGVKKALRKQEDTREAELAVAIMDCRGILSKVAPLVGLDSAAAVRYHIMRNPRLKAVFEESREKVVDTAEENIFQAVEEGNLSYSWKLLQTLGKDRGYTERREVEQQVTHKMDELSTEALIAALNEAAGSSGAIEAEFRELPPEEVSLVREALEERAPEEVESV
jgi:hypothetical protein